VTKESLRLTSLVEVNEEIARAYFEEEIARAYFEEVCGYMVRTGFQFKKSAKKRPGRTKGGAGPADIDLLISHPNPKSERYQKFVKAYGTKAMISVKGWHMEPKSHRKLKNALNTIDDAAESLFGDSQASNAAEGFFGNGDFKRILVISRLDEKFKEKQKMHARQYYKIDEIIEFKEMLKALLDSAKKRKYFPESQILQTIYTLSRYVLPS